MTTPGGVTNLPTGALTLETMQARLQDMSGGAMRSRAGERFPSIMGGSSGGTPLSDFTPFGILTRIWAEFNSAVANADPADINGPDDLPELLLSFIENLPVIGEFVGLLEAILGTYDGDDEVLLQIQALFGFLRPDGKLDASFLFGELPQVMLRAILSLATGGLLGNVELGQLWRPAVGQEKNWLEPFDSPESIKTDTDPNWAHDATVGRTAPGSAKCTLDGAEHVQTSEAIEAAPGQPLDIGGKLRWDNFTGTGGPAFVLRTLAYNAGDQLLGSQQIGAVTPSTANAPDFEAGMAGSWAPPANTAYVRVRMECTTAATGGTVNWDDLWLRKPAQNLPQAWISGLVEDLGNLFGWLETWIQHGLNALGIPIVGDFFQQITDLADGFGSWQAQTDGTQADLDDLLSGLLTDPVSVIGEIPKALIGDLDDALDLLLPKTDWTKFLTGFTAAGNNGTAPSTGIPALDGLINSFLGVRSTATGAQESVSAVASSALTTVVVNPDETITRTVYAPGSYTWNRPAPSSGKKITKFGIHVIGAGQAGGKAEKGNGQGAKGGIDGGSYYLEVLPADMPSSLSVVVANGPAGATSTGPGAMPSATRVMNGATVFAEATMGAAFAKLVGAVPVRLETKPGRGGDGGDALLKDITTDSNGAVTGKSYSRGDGEDGESCAGGVGGAGGRSSGGWLGGSQTAAQPGPAARTDPIYRFGAPGAGGGYAGPNSTVVSGAGAAGGTPGGGGSGGGGSPYTGFGGGTGNGGAGGPGEIAFYVFEEPA